MNIRCEAVFFFSSRRRHTRFDCDWSSDVCSSDLPSLQLQLERLKSASFLETATNIIAIGKPGVGKSHCLAAVGYAVIEAGYRSEERRVGKECRSRWSPYH